MYSSVQQLKGQGFSKRKVSKYLEISRNTVRKYWDMPPDEYIKAAENIRKSHALNRYEPIILNWLYQFSDMSAAQVHDWLLEHYQIKSGERTTRRFVELLRDTHKIKKRSPPRSYEAVDELPMGYQMQVDFGVKHMRTPDGKYLKVYFVGFVLSHSRYKWGYFRERPFTSADLIQSLHNCFEYIGGKPYELVFDQDSIVAVNENYGDIIYTYEFEKFKQAEQLKIFLCRKADPESKGQVESVVKYIKNNFLPNRFFMGIDLLNQSFAAWLNRTGNAKIHGTTKKVPAQVFEVEREHLRPVLFTDSNTCSASITRMVRKDNTVLYESNRYSVPLGTYNREKQVVIRVENNKLIIEQQFSDYIIAEHTISSDKGKLIKNRSHGRNTEQDLDTIERQLSDQFDGQYETFFKNLRHRKSRYFRDQASLVSQLISEHGLNAIKEAIKYCEVHEIYSATDLRDIATYLKQRVKEPDSFKPTSIKTITNAKAMSVITQKRNISEYDFCSEGVQNESNIRKYQQHDS